MVIKKKVSEVPAEESVDLTPAKPKAKRGTTGQVNTFSEELAKYASQQAEMESDTGKTLPMVSCRGGEFSFGGNLIGETMEIVILDGIKENALYLDDYDADNPTGPDCFAFGRGKDADMAPHENVLEPCSKMCKGCPNNEWGSADKGKGKACKNIRRIQFIMADQLDNVGKAEVRYMKIPVTSVEAYSTYVSSLTKRMPTFGAITQVDINSHKKTQFKLSFALIDEVADLEVVEELAELRKANKEILETPYASKEAPEEKPAPKNSKLTRGRRAAAEEADDEPAPAPKRGGRRFA